MSQPLLTEPDQLAAMLHNPATRVLDATVFLEPAETGYRAVSGLDRYREGHVPGAAFMSMNSKSKGGTVGGTLWEADLQTPPGSRRFTMQTTSVSSVRQARRTPPAS